MAEQSELESMIEGGEGISVLPGSTTFRNWNGIAYKAGLSESNVNAKKLSMNVATIPPGGVAKAHIHVGFERKDSQRISQRGGCTKGWTTCIFTKELIRHIST